MTRRVTRRTQPTRERVQTNHTENRPTFETLPVAVAEAPVDEPVAAVWDDPGAHRILHLETLDLLVSPFRSFREVGRFQESLNEVPGVRAAQARQLQRGVLQVRLQCHSSRDLLAGLSRAYTVPFYVVSQEPHRVELMLEHIEESATVESRTA